MVFDFSIDFSCSSSSSFVSCCCVPNCVFFYAATTTAAAAVFLYLFIKRLCVCVCVSFYYPLCVRACACRSLILFCCFSVYFFFSPSFIQNSLIYSQVQRKKKPTVILSFFSCACVLIPTRLLCVCGFFFCWLSLGFWIPILYISGCVYVCCACDHHRQRKNIFDQGGKFLFCSNAWIESRVRFLFFNGVIIYLYVYVFSVYLYVLFSVLKNNIHQRYINMISFNG